MTNKFLPSTSSPNDEINIVQVQVLVPLLVHVRYRTYKNNVMPTPKLSIMLRIKPAVLKLKSTR